MKRLCLLLALVLLCAGCSAASEQTSAGAPPGTGPSSPPASAAPEEAALPQSTENAAGTEEAGDEGITEEETEMRMTVEANGQVFYAALEQNDAVRALVRMMEDGPVQIEMRDYSGFEKVGPLGQSLPASDSQTTTQAGDIMLYNGDQIVIFYGSNSWSYTRIGHIEDLTGWADALGGGDLTVRFSIEK